MMFENHMASVCTPANVISQLPHKLDGHALPIPVSFTHKHIQAAIQTEIFHLPKDRTIRILEVGCGNGEMICYLTRCLQALNPGCDFQIFAFDVGDHGVQSNGYFAKTLDRLFSMLPDIPWTDRIFLISSAETWPFPDDYFDIIYSNQVVEHISDHRHFFSESFRTLRQGGTSLHLFPLKHSIFESHIRLPFAHWIQDFDVMVSYIKLLSRLGMGKFKDKKLLGDKEQALERFADRHADYLYHYTNYLTRRQILSLSKDYHLRASFRYTKDYYFGKLRYLIFRAASPGYSLKRNTFWDAFSAFILRYISNVTLRLQKMESYQSGKA